MLQCLRRQCCETRSLQQLSALNSQFAHFAELKFKPRCCDTQRDWIITLNKAPSDCIGLFNELA